MQVTFSKEKKKDSSFRNVSSSIELTLKQWSFCMCVHAQLLSCI